MRRNNLFSNQTAAEFASFFTTRIPNKSTEENREDNRQNQKRPTNFRHLGLSSSSTRPVVDFFVDPAVNKKAGPSNQKDETQCEIDNTQLRDHDSCLLFELFNYKGGEHQKQGKSNSSHQVEPKEWFPGQGTSNENGKRNLGTIVKEFSQVFVGTRFHRKDSLSNGTRGVKMNMNNNYDNKSNTIQPQDFSFMGNGTMVQK